MTWERRIAVGLGDIKFISYVDDDYRDHSLGEKLPSRG